MTDGEQTEEQNPVVSAQSEQENANQTPLPQPVQPKNFFKSPIFLVAAFILIILLAISSYSSYFKPFSTIDIPKVTETPTVTITPTPTIWEETIIVTKGKDTIIPNTEMLISYLKEEAPPADCFDCGSSIVLNVKENQKIKELVFVCGGLSGNCTKNATSSGYIFNLTKMIGDNVLELSVKKE